MKNETAINDIVINELISLLTKANAHASFHDAVDNIPFTDLGKVSGDLPYSIWQITKHIHITQKDILEFSTNKDYKEMNWPADYWPKEAAPKNEAEWKDCLKNIEADLNAFINLLKNSEDIYAPFEHGKGQNLIREAMLIADHTSYHTGEIIVLRRLLGNWKK